jgi:antitoxin (DNA-binding transcriptional repressor) of toxin-antitoxin stability system
MVHEAPADSGAALGRRDEAVVDNVATRVYIELMRTVGVRELKNRLSEYLRHVRTGEGVLVTDRGEVVAELAAPGRGAADSGLPRGLLALARRNLLTPGTTATDAVYPAFPRTKRRHRSNELLDEERGTR